MAFCPNCKKEITWKQFNNKNICVYCESPFFVENSTIAVLLAGGLSYLLIVYGLLIDWKINPTYIKGSEIFWWTYESILFIAGFVAWCFCWENIWWRKFARLSEFRHSRLSLDLVVPTPFVLGILIFLTLVCIRWILLV